LQAVIAAADKQQELTGRSLHRLRRGSRLPDAAAFSRVFRQAVRSRDEWFTVLCRETNCDVARLGLAISKKNCRQATGRNRIKRVVRESFRQNQAALVSLDLVVINQRAAAGASNRQLFESLAGHWKECRLARRKAHAQE